MLEKAHNDAAVDKIAVFCLFYSTTSYCQSIWK
jgi:hypothetical protein